MIVEVLSAEPRIPRPWEGLERADPMIRALFEPSDKKEIDGILDVKAARPTTIDKVPEGTKIHRTLTILSLKKNGTKKGQAKSRVVLDGSAMDCEHTH